ncbi:MAG TPA: hypothetical protein VF892_22415 [Pseudonocardiaceae bacterium]
MSDKPTATEIAQGQVMDLFAAVCGNPDDRGVCTDADTALAELDVLLDALPTT